MSNVRRADVEEIVLYCRLTAARRALPRSGLALCLLTYLSGVACRISELVIDAADPERLAAFWSTVLGYVELSREDDGSIEIGPPEAGFGGPQPTLIFSLSSDQRAGKLRLHIDVSATDRDQDAELERVLALGARPADVGQAGTESWRRPGHGRRPGRGGRSVRRPPSRGHAGGGSGQQGGDRRCCGG